MPRAASDRGVLQRPPDRMPPAGVPVRAVPVQTAPRRAARWRSLWGGVTFGALVLLATVVVLGLIDWVVFDTPLVVPRLPISNKEASPNDKLLLAAHYGEADVLYLGDSRVTFGINPLVVSRECGCGSGFNGGFPAAEPRLTRIMADRLVRRLSPRLVVISVSQWDLSDAANIRAAGGAKELVAPWELDEFDTSLDYPDDVREVPGLVWRLYKHRGELRSALTRLTSGARRDTQQRGFEPYREKRRLRERDLDEREEQWFTDFSLSGRRTEALRGLLADLRRQDIQVLLVALPLYPNFHARVRREVEAYRAVVTQLAAEHGAAFEDLTEPRRSGLARGHFLDVVHLNEPGTTRFSRHLGTVIRKRFGRG